MSKNISGIEECKRSVKHLIRFGYSKLDIVRSIGSKSNLGDRVISDVVDDVISEYPNYGLIQKAVRSKLICDIEGEDSKIKLLDLEHRVIEEVHRNRLFEAFDPKYDFKSRIYTARYEYRPLDPGLLIQNNDGVYTYNTYKPPKWQEDWFYSEGDINPEKVVKIPAIYEKFLKHLTGGDVKSYDYILKWLANGVKRKNYCYLATIGKQGIGKGVLGHIMEGIFGKDNFNEVRTDAFKSKFNSQVEDRRLVYADEIDLSDRETEDRFKLMVNDSIEIERKGVDAVRKRNYANFYISSNHLDSINITADDRRFSIVELTETKLIEVMTDIDIKELLEENNIFEFARYLWHFKVDVDEMSKVFVTERTSMVRAMGLKEWEEWFIMEYCPEHTGEVLKIFEAGEIVKENFGWSTRVGRGRFTELMNKYPEVIKVSLRHDGDKRSWVLEIV